MNKEMEFKNIVAQYSKVASEEMNNEMRFREDLGFIPSFADWARSIRAEPWMGRTQKIEAEVDPHPVSPVREVR